MRDNSRYARRFSVLVAVLMVVCALSPAPTSAGPPVGDAPGGSPMLDRSLLGRLRASLTPGREAMLAGMKVDVGVEQPNEVVLPLLVLGTSKTRRVTLKEIRISGPDGKVRATVRPREELPSASSVARTKAEVFEQLADADPERARKLFGLGYTADVRVPVADLDLPDSSTTTLTATATFDVDQVQKTAALALPVTVAALPTDAYWAAGDGHVHSSTWSDGWYSTASRVSQALSNGHKWLALTDHWGKIWSVDGKGNANWQAYCGDCSLQENAFGIPVLPGVEMKAKSGDSHTLGYGLSSSKVPPREGYFSAAELVAAVNAHTSGSSFAVAAHPYSPLYPWEDFGARFRCLELMSNEAMANDRTIETWFALLRGSLNGKIGGGEFPVGVANTDAHYQSPGSAGVSWIRSSATPLTREAVSDAIKTGSVSASGRGDLGHFTLNGVEQGGVAIVGNTGSVTLSITQRPRTGRKCTEISVRDSNNKVVWKASNPQATTYSAQVGRPSVDTFFVVKMVFSTTSNTDFSHVWCNPVFVDRR